MRPGQRISLQVSAGSAVSAAEAGSVAKALGIAGSARKYSTGQTLADLVVPTQGIQLLRTDQVKMPLAELLSSRMPFAIAFDISRWYSPAEAIVAPLKRVPFSSSSFGVSVACLSDSSLL